MAGLMWLELNLCSNVKEQRLLYPCDKIAEMRTDYY